VYTGVKDVCGRGGGDDDDGEERSQEPSYAQPKCKTRIRFFFYPRLSIKSAGGNKKKVHKEAELKRPPSHPTNTVHDKKIRSDSLSTAQLVVLKNERKEKTNEIIFFRL
jgi:hypothetical protein